MHYRPIGERKTQWTMLCFWAVMHRLRYRVTGLTRTVRCGHAKSFNHRTANLGLGTHSTTNQAFGGLTGQKILSVGNFDSAGWALLSPSSIVRKKCFL